MKNKFKMGRARIVIPLIILIGVLVFVGLLMHSKLQVLLGDYVENQVTVQAEILAELLEEKMEVELSNLENISWQIEHETLDVNTFLALTEEDETGGSWGILELGGNALCGEKLEMKDFSGIQSSFRGKRAASYHQGRGMLFTVPVYRGSNVKYVLYKLISQEQLGTEFAMNCYGGKGRVLIANRKDQIVVPFSDWTDADEVFLKRDGVKEVFSIISEKMNIASAATSFYADADNSQYLFVAEAAGTEFLLVGAIPESVASEGLFFVMTLIIWVFGLLLLLLVIGMVFMFGAEEKVRESDELREAKMLADAANMAKTEFLAKMSHEIRTPINAIMGMNEMVLRETDSDEIMGYALMIQNSSNALLSIVNDVLDISKIEAGKVELYMEDYELAALLTDCYNMIEKRAREKKLGLEFKWDAQLPGKVSGDMLRVRQILMNLLTNAVKYTPEGRVEMMLSGEQQDDILYMKVEVTDTGIGISEENIKKLFEKFERFDIQKNHGVEGTGLGMCITKELLLLMGGNIEIESEVGRGSTFTVVIPQRIVDRTPIGKPEVMGKHLGELHRGYRRKFVAPRGKILVVDDVDMNLQVVKKLLKETKLQIDTAASGKICLEMTALKKYDAILLDHMMPGMDGIETLAALRRQEGNPNVDTPVIMLTANALSGEREKYLEVGFIDYLTKPIVAEKLESALMTYLPSECIEEEETSMPSEQAEEVLSVAEQGNEKEPLIMEERNETEPVVTEQRKEECMEQENLSLAEQIEGLNLEAALVYCAGSKEFLEEMLKDFAANGRYEKLEKLFGEQDWNNYRIEVHALKSTAKTLGLDELSELARELEFAQREGNIELILEKHGPMMEKFHYVIDLIQGA